MTDLSTIELPGAQAVNPAEMPISVENLPGTPVAVENTVDSKPEESVTPVAETVVEVSADVPVAKSTPSAGYPFDTLAEEMDLLEPSRVVLNKNDGATIPDNV